MAIISEPGSGFMFVEQKPKKPWLTWPDNFILLPELVIQWKLMTLKDHF